MSEPRSDEEVKRIWQKMKEGVPTVEEVERRLNAHRKLAREKAKMPNNRK